MSPFWKALPLLLLLTSLVFAAAPAGVFHGEIVPAPEGEDAGRWLYVKGRNGMLRRVDVASARIVYAASVKDGERRPQAAESLVAGAEVRVTAEQNPGGEWRAQRVEITRVAPAPKSSPQTASRSGMGSGACTRGTLPRQGRSR